MNSLNINNLPYRNNVCCVVYKENRFLLLQDKGWPTNWWKFPQGGINTEETIEQAAMRELKEETGSDNFRIIGLSKNSNVYDWNDESVKLAGYRWRGQNQKYLLVEYFGEINDINFNINETWLYNCQMNIVKNTVNTVTVHGSANGLTAIDYAIATVLVNDSNVTTTSIVPKLPNTGSGEESASNGFWYIIIAISIVGSLSLFYIVNQKRSN